MPLPSVTWREKQQVFEPIPRHLDRCLALPDGKIYAVKEKRSDKEHNLFFAVLAEAFAQFPEEITGPIHQSFATEKNQLEKFRAESLIDCGFCSFQAQNCFTPEGAALVASVTARREPYSRIENYGSLLKIYVPESMAIDESGVLGMPRKRFQEVKKACFEYWAHTIGVSVDELVEQAGQMRHTT